jgi:hypothetical protein
MGYYEMARAVPGPFTLLPEQSRVRHRVLSALRLPASLFDPYPTWVLQKD